VRNILSVFVMNMSSRTLAAHLPNDIFLAPLFKLKQRVRRPYLNPISARESLRILSVMIPNLITVIQTI
jgi:hypothetical protein